jgi:hydroxymethyl cephem carbamoyltransferase
VLVVALSPDHDGAVAVVGDGKLLVSLESEKDSFPRHSPLTPTSLAAALPYLDAAPDVFAVGGWQKHQAVANRDAGAGYRGSAAVSQTIRSFGKDVTVFSSTHEQAHIMCAVGMAPPDEATARAALVWEGLLGGFYLLDENLAVTRRIPVLEQPGVRYAFLYALADPTAPDRAPPRIEDAGKLMALAAYGDPDESDSKIAETVERILSVPSIHRRSKEEFRDSPIYNAGLESEVTQHGAALLTERLFQVYADVAKAELPAGIPLHIAGGCGLNCDWNVGWRRLGHFSSVFVPPCANDSGSALGTAIDAHFRLTGRAHIEWDVYTGLEFEWDSEPDAARWQRVPVDDAAVADALADGRVFAWVQGRWEIGPRALGNRSLLAAPFDAEMNVRLNEIKQREGFRPIAPCCRVEDLGDHFDEVFEDPYMLYFRMVTSEGLAAVTHVDGTARCQTVSRADNARLHDLLTAFKARTGVGALCNTSLNFKSFGFINRMSDLAKYCEQRGIDDMVVGDAWFRAVKG